MPKEIPLELKLEVVRDVRNELAQIIHTPNYPLSSYQALQKKWSISSAVIHRTLRTYLLENELNIRNNYIAEQNMQLAKTRFTELAKDQTVIEARRLRMQKLNQDLEFRATNEARLKLQNADPEFRAKQLASLRKLHHNPQWQEANKEGHKRRSENSEWRVAQSERMRRLSTDPTFQDKCRASLQKVYVTPEWKIKHKKQVEQTLADPAYHTALHNGIQKRNADPAWQIAQRTRLLEKNANPQFQSARIEGIKRRDSNPTYIAKMKEVGRKSGLRAAEQSRTVFWKNEKYHSTAEATVADLLATYIPGYKPIRGETWQVRNKGITNGGIDFLVETAAGNRFVEYHPPKPYKNKSGGDFADGKEYAKFVSIKNRLEETKGIEYAQKFKQRVNEMLTRKYTKSREASIFDSDYAGIPLIVCTTPQEVYAKIIAPHTTCSEQEFMRNYRATYSAISAAQKVMGPHYTKDKAA